MLLFSGQNLKKTQKTCNVARKNMVLSMLKETGSVSLSHNQVLACLSKT